ncbi:MAG TPA: hypothetical protein VJ749_13930 [Pyrinomonadaceae bacterium]|nr:hypothetical protein [Pyrinomonadaceae bacterium]
MKRCPECLFIYPDSDTRCDFDNTPLVGVDESEIEAVTKQSPKKTKQKRTTQKRSTKKRSRKPTALTAVFALLLGLSTFVIYYRSTHHQNGLTASTQTAQLPATPITSAQTLATPIPTPGALTTASPSPRATPAQPSTSKPATERIATAHTTTTVAPISTSGPGMIKKGKATILLMTGSKLSADEVWRTRDGVWYRRDGIVTLLKRGQVKAIINQ